MKLSRGVMALAAFLALNVVVAVLLSPLGFESRPTTALTVVGIVAIGTVFAGIISDVVAIVFLLRGRIRTGSILALVGSVLFIVPNVADRIGSFFTLPIPPVVNVLEYVHIGLLLVILVVAAMVYRESKTAAS